jgi:putative tryptophan/tyrosine transport system substrate-binding protein
MKRRRFLGLVGGAAAWPLAVGAQQTDGMRRIGILMGAADDADGKARVAALREGLQRLGWVEGRTVTMDVRLAGGDVSRMRTNVAELVATAPDVIVATNSALLHALGETSRHIPVVFVLVANVVESGLVESLARPGGNITGFTNFEPAIAGKWLEILKEAAPRLARVFALHSAETSLYSLSVPHFELAGARLGVTSIALPVRDDAEIEQAIDGLAREPNSGLIVMPGPINSVHRHLIFRLAARHRLPAIYPYRVYCEAGGLISYGVDLHDLFRSAASYVDRILRGEKPGNLPIQTPTRYELVINLQTAKALGLDVPPTLLARADEVIE